MKQYRQIEDGLSIGLQSNEKDLQETKQDGIITVIDFRMLSETAIPNADLTKQREWMDSRAYLRRS